MSKPRLRGRGGFCMISRPYVLLRAMDGTISVPKSMTRVRTDGERQRYRQQDVQQIGQDLRYIAHQHVIGEFADVGKDRPPFSHAGNNGSEIIVEKEAMN